MAQPEHLIQDQIRLALSAHQCTVFRVNVGKVRLPVSFRPVYLVVIRTYTVFGGQTIRPFISK